MKVQEVINRMQSDKILDERKVFVYAISKGFLGGIAGAIQGAVLLSVYQEFLYLHRTKLDNTYTERLGYFHISELQEIKVKAGLFGGKFSFVADGQKYRFQLPSRANHFVGFFVK